MKKAAKVLLISLLCAMLCMGGAQAAASKSSGYGETSVTIASTSQLTV